MTLNYEMKKILILVQSCNDDFFKREIECIKETYASNLPPNIDFVYYTGNNVEPEVNLSMKNTVLVQGRDYKVVYSNNVNLGKGTLNVFAVWLLPVVMSSVKSSIAG